MPANDPPRHDAPSSRPAVTEPRIHAALPVHNLERSIAFYTAFFGRGPSKRRQAWARFEPGTPSVNLALREVDGPTEPRHPAAHFGVQVPDAASVRREARRLARAGLETEVEEGVICCYALQDRVWVTDPDGNRWETYVVLDDDAPCCAEGRDGRGMTLEEAKACCLGPGL